jgi:hypothetical protein
MVLCLFGLMLALHQTSLIDYVVNVFPDIQSAELVGILLLLLGVALLTVGFSTVVSNVVETHLKGEIRSLRAEIAFSIDKALSELKTVAPQKKSGAKSCKFCGASLDEGDIFCSACGKAQE